MPITPTYPGVYIEEISSGVHTITGVPTSIAAFIGRAIRGPIDEPITIDSYGDFERTFGGLWLDNSLGYAVRDFFLNGGSQAIIVRLFHQPPTPAGGTPPPTPVGGTPPPTPAGGTPPPTPGGGTPSPTPVGGTPPATPAGGTPPPTPAGGTPPPDFKAHMNVNNLILEAASEGSWGNNLRARIDYEIDPSDPDKNNLFNLTIRDTTPGQERFEIFRNLSVNASNPRAVDRILKNESKLVLVRGDLPTAKPGDHPKLQPGQKDLWGDNTPPTNTKAENGSDGGALEANDFIGVGKEGAKKGLFALSKADIFNILCIPPYKNEGNIDYSDLVDEATAFCQAHRAFFIIDPPSEWHDKDAAKNGIDSIGSPNSYAAIFFPRLVQPNLLRHNHMEEFAPCGAVAGIFARTDVQRGVWKAPAGLEATLLGVPQLTVPLNDAENGELNPLGINCLRTLPAAGRVVWGARTRRGNDRLTDEWKYIPVRRLALFLEESLYRGTQWVVFEPNDEPLWSQIRLNVGAFMQSLFRQGAFQGQTPGEAYLVKCDKETTTQNDINLGIVNVVVGFAPLKPAEFVILKIQQLAGQIAV